MMSSSEIMNQNHNTYLTESGFEAFGCFCLYVPAHHYKQIMPIRVGYTTEAEQLLQHFELSRVEQPHQLVHGHGKAAIDVRSAEQRLCELIVCAVLEDDLDMAMAAATAYRFLKDRSFFILRANITGQLVQTSVTPVYPEGFASYFEREKALRTIAGMLKPFMTNPEAFQ
ncbi:hypothetical protein [Microvirga yunnanensis]|uniref:hypothetical protein n=1 Tax=Microvirga yunnanensis TaxID=2953740 RepID=UPI0021C91DFB|nr:hypothetical protein [Microvirga sp. HBU65207]